MKRSQIFESTALPLSQILWVRERFNWMGCHSGYDLVCEKISQSQPNSCCSIWRKPSRRLPRGSYRVMSWFIAEALNNPFYDYDSAIAELKVLYKNLWQEISLVHFTYVEQQLGILPKWLSENAFKLIGTAHQPASWWRLHNTSPDYLSALNGLIVLSSKEVSYFEQYLPNRVFFVPHGIDTSFFQPNVEAKADSLRCVFSGRWLRDLPTLAQIIDRVIAQNPAVHFDMIVPKDDRDNPLLIHIARHEQVSWHAGLSDQQLRQIYQQARLLILPILDCTANNAVLESMSCGLPIISNSVGGLSDYTRDSFADLFPVGAVEQMTNRILDLLDSPEECQKRGMAARQFAEQNLSWDEITRQTLEIYRKVLVINN